MMNDRRQRAFSSQLEGVFDVTAMQTRALEIHELFVGITFVGAWSWAPLVSFALAGERSLAEWALVRV
jgi:hypothetical protein